MVRIEADIALESWLFGFLDLCLSFYKTSYA